MTCGDADDGSSFVICFVLEQELNSKAKQTSIIAVFDFRCMMYCILKRSLFKDRIKKIIVAKKEKYQEQVH
jgi:hypothetical protein